MIQKVDKNLLELRKTQKSKKPNFVRQQGKCIKSLSESWRAPKGMHSKLRRKLRGKIKSPSIGYSSPKSVRGLHVSGLIPILVYNVRELDDLKTGQGALIASAVGQKKKLEILKKSKELKLEVLNIKDVDKYLAKVEEGIKKKKEEKVKRTREKKEKKEAKKEKKEEKQKEDIKKEEVTEEEKQKEEKEKKRKVLESRR
ncbi:MAG: 50S ribosomal protein L32e [Candidatus Woesearchaeota archaeon]